jgi:excinuclease UvrABC nuclease subunit
MRYKIDIKVVAKHWRLIPNMVGVYALYNFEDDLVYIGKANNLHERVRQHIEGETNTKDVKHNFYGVACIFTSDAEKLEKFLIKRHHPIYNIKNNELYTERYNDEHLLPEIVEMRTEKEKSFQRRYDKSMENFIL